jgi:hypothetical protein
MDNAKFVAYTICVLCLAFAGVCDIVAGQVRVGVVGLLFAVANGLVFLWR